MATCCLTYVDEMPSMEKLYQKLKGENFEILEVSIDSLGLRVVAPFMTNTNLLSLFSSILLEPLEQLTESQEFQETLSSLEMEN